MHKTVLEKLLRVLNITLLLLFSFICLYPVYFFFISSISSAEAISKGVYLYPRSITLANYAFVFKDKAIVNAFVVSILRTVVGTSLTCICSTFLAYLFTQKDLPARKFLYRCTVITMYLNAGLIPWYITMKTYGFRDNFLLYIVPSIVVAFYVILVKTYIESLSPALEESASIDGAGILRIFFSIIIPLSMPVLASIAVFGAVGQWNAWYDNFMLVSDQKLKTLQLLLYEYLSKFLTPAISTTASQSAGNAAVVQQTPMSVRITITMITMVPIMMVYPLLQKYFIKGIMLGAVKG